MGYKDTLLDSLYYNFNKHSAFSSRKNIYNAAKQIDNSITKKDVNVWYKNNNTASLHKPVVRNFKRVKTFVKGINEQFQADLCDMQKYSKYNNNYKYILTVIDCFSRFAYAIPLKTKAG